MKENKLNPNRIQRMQSLQQSQLDTLSTELAKLGNRIQGTEEAIQALLDNRIESAETTLSALTQSGNWNDRIEDEVASLHTQLREMRAERETILQKVVDKKIELRGWERLLDRHRMRAAKERELAEMMESDERFLQQQETRS